MSEGRYRLRDAIPAVKLNRWENCTDGIITQIPSGSLLEIRGEAKLNSMLEARWHNEVYAVFEADLAERSERGAELQLGDSERQ
jgi:hypothetical protein